MSVQMVIENARQLVPAQLDDRDVVVAFFGALHHYNASLDLDFTLSDAWETIFDEQFRSSYNDPNMMWLLAKEGNKAIGLLIAGVHTDSALFCHRQWVEVQALYVADNYRHQEIGQCLLSAAYTWAEGLKLSRVQLYVTASNVRAQSLYAEEGFVTSQTIMCKTLW
ncbi:MAG: GNAT family N-acetyltransferase [Anaerolineae bacterium]|nr:GNAT family N-acetyltransferase [Anaerolineae bacterium]